MWFSLFGVVLILAITFFQGLQGLFSAMINCILAILAAALAFGLYDDLYYAFLMEKAPDYGRAIALLSVFVVGGLIMRVVVDMIIKDNLHFPMNVDRAGGGIFGVVTGLIVVGMLSIGFQMLPFGRSIMGFARYAPASDKEMPADPIVTDYKDARLVAQNMWLQPDGFTVGLVSHLSAASLQGRNNFGEVYPNFLAGLQWPRNHPYGKLRTTVPRECLKVIAFWDVKPNEFFALKPPAGTGKKLVRLEAAPAPDVGTKRWAVRVQISADANDEGGALRFVPQQVRLVARDRKTSPVKEYYIVGVDEEAAGGQLIEVYPAQPLELTPKNPARQFDFVFQVPDSADFQPLFIEYKGTARAEIPRSLDANKQHPAPLGPKKPTPKGGPAPKPKTEPPTPPKPENQSSSTPPNPDSGNTQRPQGRVQGVRAQDGSIMGDQLPFELTDYETQGDMAIARGAIRGGTGRLFSEFTPDGKPKQGAKEAVSKFEVPEGKRVLQLHVNELDPKSMLGNVLRFVVQGLQKYEVFDAANNGYPAVGVYAIANVGDRKILEMVYFDETARMSNNPPKLDRIKHDNLKEDYELFFVFHVPPKAQIIRFGTGRQSEDLRPFNLVAPD